MSEALLQGKTRGGGEWTPRFITAIDQTTCIGCGRCYKVCPRDVFELVERGELDVDEDDDFYDDDDEMMVMNIKDEMDCIGCESCVRVCPKKCHSHEAIAA